MGILSISAKCSDLCTTQYKDSKGNIIKSNEYAYVPDNIGIGGGDYVEMDIDTDTGQILNWKKVSDSQIISAIKRA